MAVELATKRSSSAKKGTVSKAVARRVEDYSHWVRRLPRKSRDFH